MFNNLRNIILSKKSISIISSFFIFVIITSCFINYIHSTFDQSSTYQGSTSSISNLELKTKFSENLFSGELYELVFDRNCVVSESNEERKRVRWVWPYLYQNLFQLSSIFSEVAPYYVNILFFSLLIFCSYYFLFKAFNLSWHYKFIFLFYIAFVFQNALGEYQFSILETFFISFAIFLSKFKKFYLFLLIVVLAQLNRESGFLISLFWLVFNEKEYKKIIITIFVSLTVFSILNFRIIECLVNPDFFIPGEYQIGQFNISDVGVTINYASFLKVLMLNFFIPFGSIYYVIFTSVKINRALLFMTTVYLVIFLVAIPWHHIAVRLMLLPILIGSFYFKDYYKSDINI
jgi:hypothetical protein